MPDLQKLYIDHTRIGDEWGESGMYIRALDPDTEKVGTYDIVALDKPSLLIWLRSRGGDNPYAEDVCGILLGHGHLHPFEEMRPPREKPLEYSDFQKEFGGATRTWVSMLNASLLPVADGEGNYLHPDQALKALAGNVQRLGDTRARVSGLLRTRNFGRKSYNDLRQIFAENGYPGVLEGGES
jgi:hypothetical protein